MSILINDGRNEIDEVRCDIGEFVVSVEKLRVHMTPVFKMFSYIKSILKWERPLLSILTLISCCYILFYYPVFLLLFVLLPFPPMMFLELIRGLGKTKPPSKRYKDYFERKDDEYNHLLRQAIQEEKKRQLNMYLDILIALQRIFSDLNQFFDSLYGIISWKEKKISFLVTCLLVTLQILLFTIDTGKVLCVVVLFVFLLNKHLVLGIQSVCYKIKSSFVSLMRPKTAKKFESDENISANKEDDIKSSSSQGIDEDLNSDTSSCSEDEEEEVDCKKENQAREPSRNLDDNSGWMMSRLIPRTLRQRYMATGNCTKCDQPTSSILKKRRYCRHCGYSFCARCCKTRVPRSLLGATAPAAYQEKVLVCVSCHVFLENRLNARTEIVE